MFFRDLTGPEAEPLQKRIMCLSHEVVRFPVFQLGVLATFIYQGKTKKFLCMLRLSYESKLEFSDVLSTCERLCFKLKYWAHYLSHKFSFDHFCFGLFYAIMSSLLFYLSYLVSLPLSQILPTYLWTSC